MAENNKVEAKIEVSDGGTVKATKKKVDSLGKSLEHTGKMTNKTKRNMEGLAQRSGSTGKDFSRMSQGMGGLVAAYATVAANVFALSTAFNVLKRSADFDSMTISANNLAASTGASFVNMAQRVKEATGNQIQFEQALAATNKAVASGIDTANLEKFTDLATKAAQTFGGSTTDALNRMIDAVLRGRTELVNKMGIIVTADEAYAKYGSSIGKAATELTSFEKRQAITNTIIEEGNKSLGQTVIDPNPFEVLSVTFLDLSQDLLSFATATSGFLTTILSLFNESKLAVGAFASIIVSSILKKAIPTTEALKGAQEAATKAQERQAIRVKALMEKQADIVKKSQMDQTSRVKTESAKRLKIIRDEALAAQTDPSNKQALKGTPKSFTAFLETGEVTNRQRANLLKSVNATILQGEAASQQKFGMSIKQLKQLEIHLRRTGETAFTAAGKMDRLKQTVGDGLNQAANRGGLAIERLKLNMKGLSTQFRATRLAAQELSFIQLFTTPLKGAGEEALTFGGKVGAMGARVSAGFTKIIAGAGWIGAAIGIMATAWQFLGPVIRNTNKEQERFNTSIEESQTRFKEYIETIYDARNAFKNFREQGIAGTASELNFLSNLISESVQGPASAIEKELVKLEQLSTTIDKIQTRALDRGSIDIQEVPYQTPLALSLGEKGTFTQIKVLNEEGEALVETISELSQEFNNLLKVDFSKGISDSLSNLVNGFNTLQRISADENGKGLFNTDKFNEGITEAYTNLTEGLIPNADKASTAMQELEVAFNIGLETGQFDLFNKVLSTSFDLTGKSEEQIKAFFKAIRDNAEKLKAGAEGITTINKTMEEMDRRIKEFNKGYGLPAFAKESIAELTALKNNFISANKAIKEGFDVEKNKDKIAELTTKIREAYNIPEGADINTQLQIYIDKLLILKSTPALKAQIKEAQTLNKVLATSLKYTSFENEEGRLAIIKEIAAQKKKELESQIAVNNISISAIDAEIEIAKLAEERTDELEAQKRTLIIQNTQLAMNLGLQSESAMTAKELSESRKRALQDDLRITSHLLTLDKARNKIQLSSSALKDVVKLKEREQTFAEKLKQLTIQINDVQENLLDKELKKGSTKERQLQIDKETLENAKQRLILEEQIAAYNATRASGANSQLAMSEGEQNLAFLNSMTATLQENGNKLKDSMNILVKSFNTGINNVFKQLVSGEGSTREALQALGDSIMDGFSTVIANYFTDTFMKSLFGDILKDPVQEKIRIQNEDLQQKLREKLDLQTQDIVAAIAKGPITGGEIPGGGSGLANSIGAMGGFGSGETEGTGDKPIDENSNKIGENTVAAEGLLGTVQENSGVLSLLGITMTQSNDSLISTIGTLISVMAMSSSSEGGGLLGGLITVFGGMFAGGAAGGTAAGAGLPVPPGGGFGGPFANGGIVQDRTPYIIGEGRKNEAVVPLPNNREIPVVMKGGGSTGTVVNNYDFRNADPNTERRLRSMIDAKGKETFGRVFSEIDRGGTYAKKTGRR